jgi:hypothetical protein
LKKSNQKNFAPLRAVVKPPTANQSFYGAALFSHKKVASFLLTVREGAL